MVEQAVQSGHANIVDTVDLVAHQLCRDRGLLSNGQIGRAGADEADAAKGFARKAIHRRGSGYLVVLTVRDALLQPPEDFGVDARDEEAAGAFNQPLGDSDDLFRRLPLAEHDLRQVVAEGAVVVEFGEPQVFVGQMPQAVEGIVYAGFAARDGFQKRAERFLVDDLTSSWNEIIAFGWFPMQGKVLHVGKEGFASLALSSVNALYR